jgi:hypothetical protein
MTAKTELRAKIIEQYWNASSEEERTIAIEQMRATFDAREQEVFADPALTALEMTQDQHQMDAAKENADQTKNIAYMCGFPVGEKITVPSGNFTAQLNAWVTCPDYDGMREKIEAEPDGPLANIVDSAIESKRASITIESLTLTDLKSAKGQFPTTLKQRLVTLVRKA